MRLKKYIYTFSILWLGFAWQAQAQKDTLKVLFVGNSYTYFWNLPQTVQAMAAEAENQVIIARQSTAGGVNWKQHWDGEKGLKSKEAIAAEDWDYVVLQNHSKSTIEDLEQFMEYGERFIKLVRENGAEPLLYMTWAREHNPLMQTTITAGYTQLAEKHGVAVVPVGNMWESVLSMRPNLKLFDPDGSHPSPIGTYLTACAFYAFLMDEPCKGLPDRITTTDANGEKLYLSIMSEENAEFMQDAVDQFNKEVTDE